MTDGWPTSARQYAAYYARASELDPPRLLIGSLGVLNIGFLVILVVLERSRRFGRYQDLAEEFGFLAGLLRPMQRLASGGTAVSFEEPPARAARLDAKFATEGENAWRVAQLLRTLSAVMIAKTGHWQARCQTHGIHG
jgi:hypothetical protein